jgi:hypothetical protein
MKRTSADRKRSQAKKKNSRRFNTKRSQTRRISPALLAGLGILMVVMLVLTTVLSSQSPGGIRGVKTFANLDRSHTNQTVNYAQIPPVGGMHDPIPLNCGVYTEPVRNENAVHSLEHGAIWITYQPDLPAEEVQTLQTITRQSRFRLLSPFPGLPSPIVVSAWGYQLQLKEADDRRLLAFIQKYEQNPLGPEPGGECTGGMGNPS